MFRKGKSVLQRALSLFIVLSLILGSVWTSPVYANSLSSETLPPDSIYKPLANYQKKALAMLEYTFLSYILQNNINPLTTWNNWSTDKAGIDFGKENIEVGFNFSLGEEAENGRFVPCYFKKNGISQEYWCFLPRNPDGRYSYEYGFFTDEEFSQADLLKKLKRYRHEKRSKHDPETARAIENAVTSEIKHDERIRRAIFKDRYLVIDESNFFFPLNSLNKPC